MAWRDKHSDKPADFLKDEGFDNQLSDWDFQDDSSTWSKYL
jgi:hypothetical protein